jgi:hypothetical protein
VVAITLMREGGLEYLGRIDGSCRGTGAFNRLALRPNAAGFHDKKSSPPNRDDEVNREVPSMARGFFSRLPERLLAIACVANNCVTKIAASQN